MTRLDVILIEIVQLAELGGLADKGFGSGLRSVVGGWAGSDSPASAAGSSCYSYLLERIHIKLIYLTNRYQLYAYMLIS